MSLVCIFPASAVTLMHLVSSLRVRRYEGLLRRTDISKRHTEVCRSQKILRCSRAEFIRVARCALQLIIKEIWALKSISDDERRLRGDQPLVRFGSFCRLSLAPSFAQLFSLHLIMSSLLSRWRSSSPTT